MNNQNDRIRVHPLYARMLKAEANLKGISIKDLTLNKAAQNKTEFEELLNQWRDCSDKKKFVFKL